MEPRTAGESVERVAGLLVTAQERAGLATWDLDQPRAFLRESAVELAAWQAHRSPPPLRRLDGLARVTEALFATMGHRAPAARRVEQIDWNPATSTHATQAHARAVEEQRAA